MATQDGNFQVPNGSRAGSPGGGDGIPETIVVFAKSFSDLTQNNHHHQTPAGDNQNGAPKTDAGMGTSSTTAGFDIFGFFRNLAESMSSQFLPNYSPYAYPTMGRFSPYPSPFYPPQVTFWPCPYPIPSCCGHVHVKETVVINQVTQGTQTEDDKPRTRKTSAGQGNSTPAIVSITKNEDKHGTQNRPALVTEAKDSQSGQGSILIPNKINSVTTAAKVPTTTPARAVEPRSLPKDAANSPKPSRWDYNPVLVQLEKNWQSEPKFTVIGGASKDPRLQPHTRARKENEELVGPAPKKLRSEERVAVNNQFQPSSSQTQEQRYGPGPKSKTQSKTVQFLDDQVKPNERPQRACKAHNRYERNCKLCCDDAGHK